MKFAIAMLALMASTVVASAQYYPRIDPYRWAQNNAYRQLNPWYRYPSGPNTWAAPHAPHYAPSYSRPRSYDWSYGGGNRGYLGGRGGGWGGEW